MKACWWLVFSAGVLLIAGLSPIASAQEKVPLSPSAVFVVVDRTSTGMRYRVDSKNVTKDPLRGLAEAFEERGAKADIAVVALIDDRLPINILSDVAGLIGKVGFSQPRYFRYRRGTSQMGEIYLGSFYAVPKGVDLDTK